MRNQRADFTMGNLWLNIWQLSWPMFLIMVLNFLVGITDVYVAGLINPRVQAAVGFISQIYFFIIIIANAISIGTLALISRSVGAGDREAAAGYARQSLLFSLFVAALLTVTGVVFYREILMLSGFPEEIRSLSGEFLRIFSLSLGPNYVLIISNAVFRASGEVKKPLLTMFIVSVINIIGNFVLVLGIHPFPKMGAIGIAVATASSLTVGMIINLLFFTARPWRAVYTRGWNISLTKINQIIVIGWPAAMLQIAWNAGSIVLYNILARLGAASINALASITNGYRIEAIIFLPAFALNMSASVLIGQNLGAGNQERAEKLGWKITAMGSLFISIMALMIFIPARELSSLFSTNPAVIEETTRYLRINMLSEPFMALSVILAGALQGAGDTKGVMWIIMIAMWFIRLPLAYFLAVAMDYGAMGAWMAMITSMIIQGLLITRRFHKGKWKTIKFV